MAKANNYRKVRVFLWNARCGIDNPWSLRKGLIIEKRSCAPMTFSNASTSSRSPRQGLAVVILAFAAGLGTWAGSHALLATAQTQAQPPAIDPEAIRHANTLSDAFKAVAKAVAPSVVNIRSVQRLEATNMDLDQGGQALPFDEDTLRRFFGEPTPMPRERIGEGSGVIIRDDGYIVTNNHVVENATDITVTLSDDSEYKASAVGADPETDLAVVKIDAGGLTPAPFGDSDDMEVGDWVVAIGSPFGLRQTVTAGIVSAKGRQVGIIRSAGGSRGFEDFIQTDAAINPGNSGGPLLNLEGQIIGINTAISSRTGVYNGVGFAIPSSMVEDVFNSIREHGSVKRGALGVGIDLLTRQKAEYFGYDSTRGALVTQVYPGSPAAKAGVKVGDIITEIDGEAMADNRDLMNLVARHRPGDTIDVKVFRKGDIQEFEITLADRSAQFARAGSGGPGDAAEAPSAATSDLGLRVEELTPEVARQIGAAGQVGVVVSEVAPGSAAAEEGLARADVIAMVGEEQVTSVDEFNTALKKADLSKGVSLQVFRGEIARLVVLKPKNGD
jgi:serine protease Do